MEKTKLSTRMLRAASLPALVAAAFASPAFAQSVLNSQEQIDGGSTAAGDIIVTAQKNRQSINKVGMSITAATGEQLVRRGITDVAQLAKVVPGFNYTVTSYSTPVYSIRGIGFQETSLAASPAVSIYVDEIPLSYPAMTLGASLDLERVEVLKGPQGTLYGQNSTGGAVNYIAAKPTDTFQAGVDASYGRFNNVDLSGFVSGPLSETLTARLAVRSERSSGWQKSYTRSDTLGEKNMLQGRLLLDWKPTERLKIALKADGWRDRGETPAVQATSLHLEIAGAPAPAGLVGYPFAPSDPRAADWTPGRDYRRNNRFYQGSGRIDYDLNDDLQFSSITAYQHYQRRQRVDADGTTLENFEINASGYVKTFFQELRLSGKFSGGNWIAGANYQSDKTLDRNLLLFNESTVLTALAFGDVVNTTRQPVKTYALYGNLEYEIVPHLKLQGGARYTKANRSLSACSADTGNGLLAGTFTFLQSAIFNNGNPVPAIPAGSCTTFNAAGVPGPVFGKLDQDNISWRAAVNWEARSDLLLYANVSKGYKAGSFPTLSANRDIVFRPATQESLLAYEAGFKATMLDGTLHVDGAVFYYDYTDKQIRGKILSQPFGVLDTLVNIPESYVKGFELSASWRPIEGLNINPAVTLVKSKIDGTFVNYNPFDTTPHDFRGEAFPYTPKWSGNVDAEYSWHARPSFDIFLGGNFSYQGSTFSAFGELPDFKIKSYTLLDLRAGVRSPDGIWSAMAFGRNVTNKYYVYNRAYVVDTTYNLPGMPATYGVTLSYRFR